MKYLIVLILSTLTLTATHAQNYQWAHGFGGPNFDSQGTSIATDAQANVYVTGTFGDSIDFDPSTGTAIIGVPPFTQGIFIVKYDSAGVYQWAFSIDGYTSYGTPHLAVNATGLYITSCFAGTVDFDPSAATAPITANFVDIVLAKYDLSGNYVWAKNMGGSDVDVANSIAIDNVGNSYITGYFNDTADFDPGLGNLNLIAENGDAFFGKYDVSGDLVWIHDLNDSSFSSVVGNCITIEGSNCCFLIAGSLGGIIDFDRGPGIFNINSIGQSDPFIAKYDTSGNFLWAGSISGSLNSSILDIKFNSFSNGDFNVAGIFWGNTDFDIGTGSYNVVPNGLADIFFAKYSNLGNLIYVKNIGNGGAGESAKSLKIDLDGNNYLAGHFTDTVDFDPSNFVSNQIANGSQDDIFFAKYDSSGNFLWAKSIGGVFDDQANCLDIDNVSSQYLSGYFTNSMDCDPGIGTAFLNNPSGNSTIFIGRYAEVITNMLTSNNENSISVTIYPNPTNYLLFINLSELTTQKGTISIYDMTGKELFISTLTQNNSINVDYLESGLYTVVLKTTSTLLYKKFIKN